MSKEKPLKPIDSDTYAEFLNLVKERVRQAQYTALKAVNKELLALYWDLGRMIVEKQERYGWGEQVVKRLSKDLKIELEGMSGLSPQNLWYMRKFYLTYKNQPKLQQLAGEIGWSHNQLILDKCKTAPEREFYLKMSRDLAWSRHTLLKQLNGNAYERWLLNQTNFESTVSEERQARAILAVKDDYNFDFLGIADDPSERELEDALVSNITKLLAEMGGYFTFVGRQFRLEVEGEEYFIDLVFYHRQLKSLVAVDLKKGEFKPEYAGKMQFYLSALDDQARVEGESPSIGIIVCRKKNRTTVEYTLRDVNRPIGVASYNHYSSIEQLPEIIAKYLPSEEVIEKRLNDLAEAE
jgi:predicted nuclease of restriction endonuclease-like (RecB) superfamily